MNTNDAQGWRIVMIDDSEDDRRLVRRLLLRGSSRRHTFIETDTGRSGVKAVLYGEALPDCVVLDYNLPDMDALDVLAELTGADGLPVCPVVVLTGGAGPEAGRAMLRAGSQDYISKDGLSALAVYRIVENAIERLAMTRELLDRNAALFRSERALSEADRRKDEFIATLAHELRNPLAPVLTGLQVLRLTTSMDSSLRTLDIMERQLLQMTRLIDDLLDISRITSGKVLLRPEKVLLSRVIDAAVEAAHPYLSAAFHSLEVDLPARAIWLEVDPTRIVQVIGNLLNNAAKYSADRSVIRLTARGEGNQVVIQVADNGLGIPPTMLEQVFDMFTQVNLTLERSQGGLGIGLALVRQLVQMHGGTVVAASAGAGHGSMFSIRLPTVTASLARVPDDLSAVAAPVNRRILVVDDNVDGAMMLAMMLELSGHDTRTAHTGEDALNLSADFNPEIIFLDIGLPGMSGYEVAQRLRATPTARKPLLVAVTGWGSEEDRRKSLEAGFDHHLTKPVEAVAFDALLSRFDRLAGSAQT